jgi:hypothetical protein
MYGISLKLQLLKLIKSSQGLPNFSISNPPNLLRIEKNINSTIL